MKKFFIYFFYFAMICFAIPIIFTNTFSEKTQEVSNPIQEEKQEVAYDYKDYNTVKLLHNQTGEIEEVALDEYICHVVSAEMPVTFELEALKAQAVVARTYTIYKISKDPKHDNADICDSSACCQAWISKENRFARWEESERENNWNKIMTAVSETKGKIVTFQNEPINAFFHSNSGGKTEIPFYVWGGSGYPYLQVVETSGEDGYSEYQSETEISKDELIQKMLMQHPNFTIDFNEEHPIQILEYTDSGRVKTIKIGNENISGVEARKLFSLRSANFQVEILENSVKFKVIGYGHGVGLSQTGSDSLAKQGFNYEEIIHHFYKDVEIKDI